MKNLIFYSLVFFMACSCNEAKAQEHFDVQIGKIENGKTTFIMDEGRIKSNWEKLINDNSELNLTFESVTIQKNDSDYFLIATDSRSNATSVIGLVLDGEHLFEAKISGGGYTITCSGCESTGPSSSRECIPDKEPNGVWYCTDCSRGSCKKTFTHTPGGLGK